jgi:hypothetical protein
MGGPTLSFQIDVRQQPDNTWRAIGLTAIGPGAIEGVEDWLRQLKEWRSQQQRTQNP